MKFNDLQAEYNFFKEEIDKRVKEVFDSGIYLFGKQLEEFERAFPASIGLQYGIGVKNCTDALMIVLSHLVKDRNTPIILPNFGAAPTAMACKHVSDNLHYVDVDSTFTIDISKLPDIKNGIVVAVNLFGNNININLKQYTHTHNHILIEDCAQSAGSGSGMSGNYLVFSFYPTKPLAAMGDGGMICTDEKNSVELFKKIRQDQVNSRLDEIQSAILNVKLEQISGVEKYKELTLRRKDIAYRYKEIVEGISEWTNCVYHQFPMLYYDREAAIIELNKRQIPYMIHYPYHLPHLHPGKYNRVGVFISDKILSLPVHPFMTEDEIQQVEEFLRATKSYEYQIL